MSLAGRSLLSSDQLSEKDIEHIFSRATHFKHEFNLRARFEHLVRTERRHVLALVFAEPSTRTRLSFQIAAERLGVSTVVLDNPQVSSLSKGESLEDTLLNVAAMKPDAMVVRYNTNVEADRVVGDLGCPVINGGIGANEHPTQALLDAFTIREQRGQIKGERVLIVGDVLHSRVANSNLMMLERLGAEVAYCAPAEFVPQTDTWRRVKSFAQLKDAVEWATVIMGLRIQSERHPDSTNIGNAMALYRERYRLGGDQLKSFRHDGIVLHPGPVIKGLEFSASVLNDKRCKVLDQVTNGVFTRAALISTLLGLEVQTQ